MRDNEHTTSAAHASVMHAAPRRSRGRACALALAILPALLAAPAFAQKTWDGGGTSGNWSDALNWNADTLPSLLGGQTLEFSGTSQLVMNNDLTITGTLNGGNGALYFSNDGTAGKTGNFSLSGNSLNWGQTIYAKASTSTLLSDTVALNLVLVGATRNFRSGQNHSLTLSGTISQSGGNYAINLAGPEMLYITGTNNSFSGSLFVNNATTITKFGMANANSSIGTNGVIRFSPGFATQVNGAASSNEFWAALVYSGAGESTDKRGLMQTDGGWAPTVVPMQIRNNGSGALTFTSGTFLDPLNTWSYGFIPRVVAFTGSNSGGVNEIRGVIQDETAMAGSRVFGAYQVVKGGLNTWVLSGTNAYSGGSIINSGTLRAGSDRALGAASSPLVINGGALDLASRNLTVGSLSGNSGAVITSSSAGASSLTVSTAGPSPILRTGVPNANATLTGFAGSIQNGQGTVSLTKGGTGTLVLAGSNSYTGATTVNGGTLAVSFANFANSGSSGVNAIASTSALALGGGALQLQGIAGGTNTQAFASLAVNSGAGGLVLSGSNALLLNVGAITRSPGGTLDITQPGGSLGATNGVITTTGNASGILGGYATVAGADWAVANASSAITAFTGYTNDTWSAGNNTTVTGDSSPASGATTNSLRFAAAGSQMVTLSGVNTLTSGGLLVAPAVGSGTSTITGGSLAGAALADLVIHQHNTAGELVIASTVANNGGATGVTKSGAGKATLSAANTFTGTATVNAGTLVLSAANTPAATRINGGTLEYGDTGALGSNAVTFAGNGTLRAATSGTLTNAITVNANVTAGLESTNSSAVVGGVISGSGGVAKNGTGTIRLSANNTYTGMTNVNGGRLALSGSNVGSGGVTINSGTLALDFANAATGTNILTGSTQVGLNGGTLRLEGKASTNNAQTAILWLLGGDSKIDLSANTSNNLALTASTIMRDNRMGGTLDVTLPAGTQSGSNGFVINNVNVSLTNNTSGIVSSFITVGGTTWATWSGANGFITPFTAYSPNGAGGTSMNLDVTSSYALTTPSWNSMRFNAGAATVTLAGANTAGANSVYTSGGAILVTANVGANETAITGGSMNAASGGDFVIIQNNTAGGLTISSVLNNSINTAGLTKAGPGTLTLTAANTYNGVTNINGGTLVLGNSLAMQNSWLNTSGAGTLSFGGLTAATMQFISGTGNLALSNTSSGAVTLTIQGNGNNGAISNSSWAQAALGNSPTYDGVLSGAGGVTLNEIGNNFYGAELGLYSASAPPQAFSGANTYTGATTITRGILQVSTLANGGFASGVGASDNSASNLVLDGQGTGDAISMLRYAGPAASTNRNFTINGTNAWIDASGYGPLVMSGTAAGTGTRRLVLTGSNQGDNTLSGNFSNNASGVFSIAKTGSGTWVLSGSNSFSGPVSVAAGTLGVGNSNALGTGTASFTGNSTLRAGISGTLANRVDVASGVVATVDTQSYNLALSSTITGSGGLAKLGTGQLRLSNVNTYSGTTTVSAGRLLVDGSGNLANTARVVVNGSSAELKWNSSTALSAPLTVTQGTVSGTGSISASGGVTIGTSGIISPGNSPGIQTYTTGLTWASGGGYLWEIDDWNGAPGTGYDQVAVSGGPLDITATSGSTFTIYITGLSGTAQGAVTNFLGTQNKTFTIATATLGDGGVTGFAANAFTLDTSGFTSNNTIPAGGSFSITHTATTVLLNYTYAPPYVSTSYTLSGSAAATAIHVGGTTSITAIVTNTGTGTADSLAVTGLGVTVSPSGSVTISPTSGTAANAGGTVSGNGNFSPVSSGSYSFTPTVTSATNVNIGGNATASGTTTASVTAWNYAAANSISGTVNFGTILAGGTFAAQQLSITNAAPNDGFSEKLDAAFGSPTGLASGSGSISLLAAGGTSTAMSIYLASGSAGAATGSIPVNFTSNGSDTSGLGTTSLASQTVSLAGTILDPAVASFASGSTLATLTLSFGTVSQFSSPAGLTFDLWNLMQTSGYTADLALLSISGTGDTGVLSTNLGIFNNLASGSFNPYTASIVTTNTGSFQSIYTLEFKSANNSTVFTSDTPQYLTLTVQGVVVVPEPGAIALAAAGLAAAAIARRRRRTPARVNAS